MVFMITSLKNPVPLVIKACPEVTVSSEWLSTDSEMYFSSYKYWIFKSFIRAVVADNVNAFNILVLYNYSQFFLPKYFYFLTLYIYWKIFGIVYWAERSLYFLILHLKYQIFIFLPRIDIWLGLTYTKYITRMVISIFFFMRRLLQLVKATFLIELTCQTSLNQYYAGGQ